jgi:chemotaxis protein methyltransferase CheR
VSVAVAATSGQPISDRDFHRIREWLYQHAGIHLSDAKKALVCGRLASRIRHYQLSQYGEYLQLIEDGRHPEEAQVAVDLLTTNETHFFREPKHFDFLREQVVPAHDPKRTLRVWSAACSSGEEPYSIAMTLASALKGGSWEVLASDLSSRVLERARGGLYRMDRARTIAHDCLVQHCLKGTGRHEGTFMVAPQLAARVQFSQINLNEPLPAIGEFDVIFLRNVMIYFDVPTKQQVTQRVLGCLRAGGHLVIGHSESLTNVNNTLKAVAPSVYRKP